MDPGQVVCERFRVERELGSGGMGAVYLAHDLERGRDVALKLTAAAGRGMEQVRARFEREAAIGCALGQERGFVRAFEWGELPDKRTLYMAMDLVRGGKPLDLKGGSLPERLRRLEAAAERVAGIHALGVVHRDLKPTNFLVDAEGVTWLLDFGLAKLRGESEEGSFTEGVELTRTGVGLGTPMFMAPEQFEDAKAIDPRGDVYALGVMLFYALTGSPPYPGQTPMEIYKGQMAVQSGDRPAPRPRDTHPQVTLGLDALAAEATALDPARRTSTATIFLTALRRARTKLEGLPSSAMEPPLRSTGPALGGPSAPTVVLPGSPSPSAPSALQPSLGSTAAASPRPSPPSDRAPAVETGQEMTRAGVDALRGLAPWLGLPLLLFVVLFGAVAVLRGAARLAGSVGGDQETPQPALPDPGPPRIELPPIDRLRDGAREALRGEAAYLAGLAYETGDGVAADLNQARLAYERAGEHPEALFALGELYEFGRGVDESTSRARGYYQRAARLGHVDAELRLVALEQQEAWNRKLDAEERARASAQRERQRRQEREARRRQGG